MIKQTRIGRKVIKFSKTDDNFILVVVDVQATDAHPVDVLMCFKATANMAEKMHDYIVLLQKVAYKANLQGFSESFVEACNSGIHPLMESDLMDIEAPEGFERCQLLDI